MRLVWCISVITGLAFGFQAEGADLTADTKIKVAQIYADNLLPVQAKNGLSIPTFKFFDEGGKLVGARSHSPAGSIIPLSTAVKEIPKGFASRSLADEAKLQGFSPGTGKKTVVAYVMNGFCAPCADIVNKVKSELVSVGWKDVRLVVVNIDVS